jgi:hypothetical protein
MAKHRDSETLNYYNSGDIVRSKNTAKEKRGLLLLIYSQGTNIIILHKAAFSTVNTQHDHYLATEK